MHLFETGYVTGRPVRIDGHPYICPCLQVGSMRGELNEWDELLDKYGEDNHLWHYETSLFWGQESSALRTAGFAAVRGGPKSARNWGHLPKKRLNIDLPVGFRPVLEALPDEPALDDSLVGHQVQLYVGNGFVGGAFVAADEYDILVTTSLILPSGCHWAKRIGKQVAVDRQKVTWIKQVT